MSAHHNIQIYTVHLISHEKLTYRTRLLHSTHIDTFWVFETRLFPNRKYTATVWKLWRSRVQIYERCRLVINTASIFSIWVFFSMFVYWFCMNNFFLVFFSPTEWIIFFCVHQKIQSSLSRNEKNKEKKI